MPYNLTFNCGLITKRRHIVMNTLKVFERVDNFTVTINFWDIKYYVKKNNNNIEQNISIKIYFQYEKRYINFIMKHIIDFFKKSKNVS